MKKENPKAPYNVHFDCRLVERERERERERREVNNKHEGGRKGCALNMLGGGGTWTAVDTSAFVAKASIRRLLEVFLASSLRLSVLALSACAEEIPCWRITRRCCCWSSILPGTVRRFFFIIFFIIVVFFIFFHFTFISCGGGGGRW